MTPGGEVVDQLLTELSTQVDELPPERRREYLVENELELVLAPYGHETPSASAKMERLELLRTQVGRLTERLRADGLEFVVIKFPSLAKPMSDIDLLVADRVRVGEALRSIGYVREDDTEPHRETYVKTVDGERVAIDLHYAMTWRRVPYVETDAILADKRQEQVLDVDVPMPSPVHDAAITAAHSVFKHNEISMFDVLHATRLRADFDVTESTVSDIAARNNWRRQYELFARNVDAVLRHLERGSTDGRQTATNLPIEFSLARVASVRLRRLAAEAADGNVETAGLAAFAYTLDVTQFVVEERLGVSMKPFFDVLSAFKREVSR